jgi:molybdopterin biosynthesis enzyme
MCRTIRSLLRARLELHLTTHEVVILSGGVSMGKFDLVPKALMQLGVEEVFHNIAQRPGKPMWFGIGPQGQSVFGLPGNPVSTLVCLIRYVIPAIAEAMGTKRAQPSGWRWRRRWCCSMHSLISCRCMSNTTIGAALGPTRGRRTAPEIF